MNLAEGLQLHAEIAAARTAWLHIEHRVAHLDDHELYLECLTARQGILGAKDRLEQLLTDPEPEPEPEGVLA